MYKVMLHFCSALCHRFWLAVVKHVRNLKPVKKNPVNSRHDINCVLIYAFSLGSQLAFRRIYDHYAPVIYRVSQRYLGSNILAEELVTKVFSTFWLERAKFSEAEQVRLYLFNKTKSVAIRLLARELQKIPAVKPGQCNG